MTFPTLRQWEHSDAPALLAALAAADDLRPQFGDAPPRTGGEARAVIDGWAQTERDLVLAIDVGGHAVGAVGLSHIERRHDTAWTWYWLAAEARGQGFAARGLATVAAFAFSDLGLFRLELGHRANNPASCRVALRAGFAAEGVERAKLRYGDQRFDVETHARLASDATPPLDTLALAFTR
jgi:RimJ/RimL family protein N-acetyltransferase